MSPCLDSRPARPSRRRSRPFGIAAGLLLITACSGGGANDTSTDNTATDDAAVGSDLGETQAADSVSTTGASPSEPEPAGEDTATPSTTLISNPDADLPTEIPSSEPGPVTTTAGPLATPAVRLLEVSTFNRPVEVTGRDADRRLYVVEQGGTIVATDDEASGTVLDLGAVAGITLATEGGEQGLLGLAFHPELDLAYVNFTDGDGDTVVAEFAVDPVEGTFDTATYREVLTVDQPFDNHNGGGLAFGPDGYLYIGLGDGGSADDPNRSALDVSARLGKMLRIDPAASAEASFTVPEDNPFVGVDGADPTIWSIGLRNPWRFSFDALTGDLWIADVGQNRLEEVNLALATNGVGAGRGLSFGWSAFEADERFNDDQPDDDHTLPVLSYAHENNNCSVSGGAVSRDSGYADLNGWYLYGDYCSGTIWGLDTTSVTSTPNGPVGDPIIVELANVPELAAVSATPDGSIYAISNAGPVYQIIPS
jgi:glucose/arabinose dehydrogenase